MEVSQEVSSMVRGWLRASPASSKRKPPPAYIPILPRPERLGLGAEPCTESTHGVRNLAVAARMERKITGRRRKQANAGSAVDATQPRGMAESHSQDLHASSDEECSRTVAVETSGLKMGGTRSQDLLLGGCEGLRRRKRKKRKQQKQEVAVSKATVSKATVSGMTNNVPNQPGSSVKLAAEEDILEDSQQLSPSAATSFDRPHEKQVLPEGLGAEATESNLDSKEPSKRPKSALDGSKKHRKTSFKKTRLRDRLSSRELDTEESSSDAAQTAKRAQYEKSMTGEVDTLKLTPICQKSNNEATASKDLLTSTQFSKSILRRRLRNARNSKKLQTSVFTYQTPALDKASWLQAMRDVDMETGVLSQRRVIHGSRARRQLQRKAFLHQRRKLMRKRNHLT